MPCTAPCFCSTCTECGRFRSMFASRAKTRNANSQILSITSCGASAHARQAHELGLQVLIETVTPPLTTEPGLLDTAEGSPLVREDTGVDRDDTDFERASHAPDPAGVLGEEVCGKAGFDVVGESDGVGLTGEAQDGRDRPKRLFPSDQHVGGDADKDRRREEVGTVRVP